MKDCLPHSFDGHSEIYPTVLCLVRFLMAMKNCAYTRMISSGLRSLEIPFLDGNMFRIVPAVDAHFSMRALIILCHRTGTLIS